MSDNLILQKLFVSKTRVAVLDIFFAKNQSLYESEISFLTKISRTTVQREVIKLRNIGLLTVSRTKTRTFYSINKKFIYFPELKKMFLK